MEGTTSLVLLVLLGVLVGAAVPALLQLRRTLKAAEVFLERTGGKLEATLDEVAATSGGIQKLLERFEHAAPGRGPDPAALASLLSSFGGIGESLRKIVLVVSALGPVVAAVAGSIRKPREEDPQRPKASAAPRPGPRPEPPSPVAPTKSKTIPTEGRPS